MTVQNLVYFSIYFGLLAEAYTYISINQRKFILVHIFMSLDFNYII